MSTYLDHCTDLQGRIWHINDRILHVIQGARSDAGKVALIYSPLCAVRVLIAFDDGGLYPAYLSECSLLRRRTKDEIPYAALGEATMTNWIKGSDLTDLQRDQVLAAFVHRHTIENAKRRGVACVLCADSGGDRDVVIPAGWQSGVAVRKRWHDHHVAVETDHAWIIRYQFPFVANGSRLAVRPAHCEPIYLTTDTR